MLTLLIKNPLTLEDRMLHNDNQKAKYFQNSISLNTSEEILSNYIYELSEILNQMEQSFDKNIQTEITIQNNISVAYLYLEKYHSAIDHASKAYELLKKIEITPNYAPTVIINLGLVNYELCRNISARDYFIEAENVLQEFSDQVEMRVLLLECLGNLSYSESKLLEAKNFHDTALKLTEELLGNKNYILAMCYNNLAITLDSQGDFVGAVELLKKCQKIFEEDLPEKFSELCIVYNNLSAIHYDEGKYDHCVKFSQKMLDIFKTLKKGENSIIHAIYSNNSGFSIMNSGRYAKGSKMIESALDIYLLIYGNEHLETAKIRNNLAIVKCNQRYFQDAKKNLDQAASTLEKLYGKDHIELAKIYHNFGFFFDHSKEQANALKFYMKSLEIYQKFFGEAHPHISIIYNNLGCSFSDMGMIAQALKYYKKSLDTKFKLLLGRDIDVARTCRNFGKACKDKNVICEAIKFYKRSCLVDTNNYDKYHQDVVSAKSNLEFMLKEEALNHTNNIDII